MKVIIETKRLILREFNMMDAEAMFAFGSNLEVSKYTGEAPLKSLEEANHIIANVSMRDYVKYGFGRWAVIYKPDDILIGFAGLKFLPEFNETDIGYRFLPEYWGKGIATECSLEIIKYGFNNLGLNKIIGIASPENIGSWKVLEKIGLKFYKRDKYDEEGEICNWYKVEKKEWLDKNKF